MRDREQNLHREKKNIRVQMKSENVERVLRQGEYKKSLTLKKIENCDRYTFCHCDAKCNDVMDCTVLFCTMLYCK